MNGEVVTSLELLWAVRDLDLCAAHKSVLFALIACAERRGAGIVMRPSVEQLVRASGLSRATVLRVLPQLEAIGVLRRVRSNRRSVAVYTIEWSHGATSHRATSQGDTLSGRTMRPLSGLTMRHSEDPSEDLSEEERESGGTLPLFVEDRPESSRSAPVESGTKLVENARPGSTSAQHGPVSDEPGFIPPDLEITPGDRAYALELGVRDVDLVWKKFVAHYVSTRDRLVDWRARWRKWAIDEIPRQRSRYGFDRDARANESAERELRARERIDREQDRRYRETVKLAKPPSPEQLSQLRAFAEGRLVAS